MRWLYIPLWFLFILAPQHAVKIGLLISGKNSVAARHGAEMAIRKANENGGYQGKPFSLVIRSIEGQWGAGSKEAVNLIFNDEVCAIVGSLDGRNAHLVEQVSAKARIVFLSAWATDPTLSQAFVPWYFSCVPNDLQQADALVDEIYKNRKLSKCSAVSDNSYDAKLSLAFFVKKAKAAGYPAPVEFLYDTAGHGFNKLVAQLAESATESIVLFGQPQASVEFIRQLRQKNIRQPVFGSLTVSEDNEDVILELGKYENIILLSSGLHNTSTGLGFGHEYLTLYGCPPEAVAAYAYDGMNLIIEAIKKNGPDREKIQKALQDLSLEAATGLIRFDGKGNRKDKTGSTKTEKGRPESLYIH